MVKLTPKLIANELPDEKCQTLQKLALTGRSIEKIVRLSACSQLIRLDLSNNSLTSLEGVSQNTTLKWLAAPGNQISTLQGLASLDQLQVLNLGHNNLAGYLKIAGTSSLRALMLNDNKLTGVDGLSALPELNTLILKQNEIADLGTSLHGCTALAKLQLGHNRLSELGSALSEASSLAELRVSHNQLTGLPQELSRNARLKIVEVGENPIKGFQQIKVLSQLPSLHQLNLRGCPLASDPAYPNSMLQQLPVLDVLDSRKLDKSGMQRQSITTVAKAAGASDATAGATAAASEAAAGVPQAELQASKHAKARKGHGHRADPGQREAGKADSKKAKRHKAAADDADDSDAPKLMKKKRKAAAVSFQDETVLEDELLGAPAAGGIQNTYKDRQKHAKKAKPDKHFKGEGREPEPGRSFLADVLDPKEDDPVAHSRLKAAKSEEEAAVLSKHAGSSGLVQVIETLPSQDVKKDVKKHKASKLPAQSGAAAALLLQGSEGLRTTQYGIGNASSWD